MKTLHLQILSFLMCMLCGLLATLILFDFELEGLRLLLASIVSIGCIPLSIVIGYAAYQEYKNEVLE